MVVETFLDVLRLLPLILYVFPSIFGNSYNFSYPIYLIYPSFSSSWSCSLHFHVNLSFYYFCFFSILFPIFKSSSNFIHSNSWLMLPFLFHSITQMNFISLACNLLFLPVNVDSQNKFTSYLIYLQLFSVDTLILRNYKH